MDRLLKRPSAVTISEYDKLYVSSAYVDAAKLVPATKDAVRKTVTASISDIEVGDKINASVKVIDDGDFEGVSCLITPSTK